MDENLRGIIEEEFNFRLNDYDLNYICSTNNNWIYNGRENGRGNKKSTLFFIRNVLHGELLTLVKTKENRYRDKNNKYYDLIFIKRLIDISYKLKRHGLKVIDITIFTEDVDIVDFKRR